MWIFEIVTQLFINNRRIPPSSRQYDLSSLGVHRTLHTSLTIFSRINLSHFTENEDKDEIQSSRVYFKMTNTIFTSPELFFFGLLDLINTLATDTRSWRL